MNDDFIDEISRKAQSVDKLVFKKVERFGKEEFILKKSVDLLNTSDEEDVLLKKTIYTFFSFLEECGWDSEFVSFLFQEVCQEIQSREWSDQTEEDPLTKLDPNYKMFLTKLGEGDPGFLQEVYSSYLRLQSLN